ncbi:MAG: hypothetical protein AAFV19_18525 [Pseudomonadota bacterium]
MTASRIPTPLSDETIVAYLDGQVPKAEAAAIDAARAQDPDLDARIAALEVDLVALGDAMDAILSRAPVNALPEPDVAQSTTAQSTGWGWRAAAAAMVFAAGLGAGILLDRDPESPDWRQAVADYQVLYTSETVTATPLDAERREAGLAHVAQRIGLDLDDARIAVDGLSFQRAQILDFNGQALGQLVYLDQTGAPIAFCLMRVDEADSPPREITLAGLAASTWNADGLGFIVIGPTDPVVIESAATELSARFSG